MKFKSKILCLLLVFVLLFSLNAVAANETTTQSSFKEVSSDPVSVSVESNNEILGMSNSEESLGAPDDGTFKTLQEKINNTAEGDTLVLENNYANTDDFDQNGITISKSLTIDGNGYTIDALGKGRIFYVDASKVILKNINFVNGNYSEGGAVYWSGADGRLSGCNFTGNNATHGGGVYWSGADGRLSGCNFVDCSASRIGGVYWGGVNGLLGNSTFVNCSAGTLGGAVGWFDKDGSVSNCSFVDCSAGRDGGGALYTYGGYITDCSFVNCSAIGNNGLGGAIVYVYTDSYINNLSITVCSFVDCFANSSGGAVYWAGPNGNLSDCSFVNCSAGVSGGAVDWVGDNGNLSDCSFVNCSASGNGGAVFWSSVSGGVLGNCSFVDCSAGTFGGAVLWSGVNGSLYGSSFVNCSSDSSGGAVFWYGDNGNLSDCSFVDCSAESGAGAVYWDAVSSGVLGNCSFVNCSAFYAGAVNFLGSGGVLDNCCFVDCSASGNGGAVYWIAKDGSVSNCSFVNCSSNATGGAVYWVGNNGNLTSSSFTGNNASDGGAVYWGGVNGLLGNSTFVDCSASGNGGAVEWGSADGTLGNCSFVNCSAGTYGGAVYWSGADGVLSGSTFTGNNASDGGAVYWTSVNNGILTNCSFFNCTANILSPYGSRDGGAVYWASENGILSNSSFINCFAHNGGAVYWASANGVLDNCSLMNNSANYSGGAVYWGGNNGRLSGSSFTNNSARDGGAVYWGGNNGKRATNGRLTGSNFIGNIATDQGGAVHWLSRYATLYNCSFVDCSAVNEENTFGGAIFWMSSDSVLGNCSFVNCYANYEAGAVFWSGNSNNFLGNCSFVNCSTGYQGGAVWSNCHNGVLDNCSFVNCSSDYEGGAVHGAIGVLGNCSFVNCSSGQNGGAVSWSSSASGVLGNCSFVNCSSDQNGGAVSWSSSASGVLGNCSFVNCSSGHYGGAVCWVSDNATFYNSSFVNCSAVFDAGAILFISDNGVLGNCSFVDCSGSVGGAVCWRGGDDGVLSNSSFINCSARNGGAVYWESGNGTLFNCSFVDCSASISGGAVCWRGDDGVMVKSSFMNNSADTGGAVYSHGHNGVINNTSFENNIARLQGGAIFWALNYIGGLCQVINSSFINNSADYEGGAIHLFKIDVNVYNSFFRNNSAKHSGAISLRTSNMTVNNSNFTLNYATHGGGAIGNDGDDSDQMNVEIINSNFDNNHANNYGGALSLERVLVDYSNFYNNSAVFGGAIYSISPTVKNSKFKNNKALELGNSIFAINKTTIENSNINNIDIYENKLSESIIYHRRGGMHYKITYEGKTYDAFAVESNLLVPGRYYTNNNVYVVDPSFKLVRNVLDSSDVSEYVKNLLYKYSKGELSYTDVSAMIDDAVYGNSAINIGEKAPVVVYIGNNMVNVYEYISLITPSSNTNLVFLKQSTHTLNYTVTKEALNKTAFVGDIVKFRINVTNGNYFTLPDVFVKDVFNDGELEYLSFESKDNWSYNVNSKAFTLKSLSPSNTSSIILSFKVKTNGNLTNIAVAGIGENETGNNNTTITVYTPQLAIEKTCLTPNVVLGETARFEIIVKNNGDSDLHNIILTENPSQGLVFDSYDNTGLWKHSVVNNKHVWTLVNTLTPGSSVSLFVNFKTTALGRLVNYADVESDETNKSTTGEAVDVIKPEIKVEKIAVYTNVTLGKQAIFEIIVTNPSKVALTGVTVYETSFDGLVYDSFVASNRWVHSVIGGVNAWTFTEELPSGEVISLFTVFNTTSSGTFINNVRVSSDTSIDAQANARVNVLVPEFKVEKIVLTPNVSLGEQAVYEIVIHNTGEADLTNIVVEEMPDASLVFDHYVDNGLFTHSFVNGKHIWTLNKLSKGTYAGFFVYFNTTASGNISNKISVKSDEIPENTTISNNTNVLIPTFSVEKICLVPNVLVGNQTQFEIVIRNTGKIELTNVYFTEESFNGLIYDGAIGEGIWTYKFENGKHTWTLNEALEADEFAALILRFNTTAKGNFTNFVSAGANQTGVLIANATVHVFENELPDPVENSSDDYKMDVFKTVVTQEVVLGGQITFQIVVHNTGNKNLENVKITEILPDGLIYSHFVDYLDLWTYNGDLTWSATRTILSGEYVSFFVTFNTTKPGQFENHITVTADKANATAGNTSFEILNPDFTIEKILIEDNIANGGQATFEIVIHNTGNAPLTNLTVREYFFDGLVYDHFVDYSGLWSYIGDLTWTMNSKLAPGEYAGFYVTFNTTKDGKFINIVVANSTECGNKFSNNATVSVHNETVDIRMISLTPLVIMGNQVTFEITVQNTGKINITALKISEYDFEGLIYDHYMDYLGHWINDGITWTLNTTLVPGEVTSLFVVFNTTKTGNFTNIILVNNDVLDTNELLSVNSLDEGIYVSAGVEVVKPEYTIEKVALNKTANIGDEIVYEIIVHNIGKVDISNITVRDIPSDGLSYLRFIDSENFWSKNSDLSWNLIGNLVPGQYSIFYVVFNATKAGNLENTLESDNLTSKTTVEVKDPVEPTNPGLTINVEVTTDPITGQPVLKVTVTNIGNVDLDNVFVKPNMPEGLKYGNYYSYDSIWNFNNDEFALEGLLKASESKSFFIEILGNPGDYQIKIDAGFNGTIADSKVVSVKVLDNSTPGNVTPEVPKDNNVKKLKSSVAAGDNATGNPILMVLLVLIALALTRFRKKD